MIYFFKVCGMLGWYYIFFRIFVSVFIWIVVNFGNFDIFLSLVLVLKIEMIIILKKIELYFILNV